jgi:hypothetical protein
LFLQKALVGVARGAIPGAFTTADLRRTLLLWRQTERFELPRPFGRSVAKPLDVDAPRQTALDGSSDQFGGEEGKRDLFEDSPQVLGQWQTPSL